jgi:hypothetical protein
VPALTTAGVARRLPAWWAIGLLLLALIPSGRVLASPGAQAPTATAERVELYFFWSARCPHCQVARPFVEALPARHPWLRLHSLELTQHPENIGTYLQMAARLGQEGNAVPAFIFCGRMQTGYDSDATTGAELASLLEECHRRGGTLGPETAVPGSWSVTLPLVGEVSGEAASLPLTTLMLAGMDAFNPCAFFVLLFLLSLLAHAHSRGRMLFVGGVFVLFSGLVYFAFMAAWLNVFLLLGPLQGITLAAGVLAVVIAAINIKDYFFFQRGVSLSIPDRAKPRLFERMRGIVQASNLPVLVTGTVMLALVANSYELLCTAGFPLVYTRILTLRALPATDYYLYLALYNVIYVIPLLLIVLAFVFTLGGRKLTETEGRLLKLLSGMMMLGLGLLLLFAPDRLNSPLASALVLGIALGVTVLIAVSAKFFRRA